MQFYLPLCPFYVFQLPTLIEMAEAVMVDQVVTIIAMIQGLIIVLLEIYVT